jgi:tRNA (cytidine32/guanosine34-2'-O)-methyltransferase
MSARSSNANDCRYKKTIIATDHDFCGDPIVASDSMDRKQKSSIARRDVYKRTAVEQGWRARSAYKLMQIDDEFHIFTDSSRVVDLCGAPGSWSQVAVSRISPSPSRRVIVIDLRSVEPIDGVICLQGDITSEATARAVIGLMEGAGADVVMADGAPDVVGRVEYDEFVQHAIVRAALAIATMLLRPGGLFLSKVFRTKSLPTLLAQLGCFFGDIRLCKPRASRLSSVEAFALCRGFAIPDGFVPTLVTAALPVGPVPRVPFVQCGRAVELDSERTYPLSDDEE